MRNLRLVAMFSMFAIPMLLLTGCSGNTRSATDIKPLSAKLRAQGTCNTSCYFYFRYTKAPVNSSSVWTKTKLNGPTGKVATSMAFSQAITLAPYRVGDQFAYQVCGYESGTTPSCAGPDGKSTSYSYFAPTLAIPSAPQSLAVSASTSDSCDLGLTPQCLLEQQMCAFQQSGCLWLGSTRTKFNATWQAPLATSTSLPVTGYDVYWASRNYSTYPCGQSTPCQGYSWKFAASTSSTSLTYTISEEAPVCYAVYAHDSVGNKSLRTTSGSNCQSVFDFENYVSTITR